jgi:hypothetical protein
VKRRGHSLASIGASGDGWMQKAREGAGGDAGTNGVPMEMEREREGEMGKEREDEEGRRRREERNNE